MRGRSFVAALSVVALLAGGAHAPGAPAPDAELAAGIGAFEAKDYTTAISTLTRVLGRLGADASRTDDTVSAYLHLGSSYAALGQESPARSQFVQALLRRPHTTLLVKDPSPTALRLFAEAKADAAPTLAAAAAQGKKGSKKPLALVGLAAVGAGVGIALGAGSGGGAPAQAPPAARRTPAPIFTVNSFFGNPSLLLTTAQPASGVTVSVSMQRPQLTFRVQSSATVAPPGGYLRLQAAVDLLTADRGPCWRGTSAPFALAAGAQLDVVVDSFPPSPACAPPFTTLAMEARIFDLAAGGQLSISTYTGGYQVVP